MSVLTSSDLQHSYAQGTTKGDDPKLRGEPDSSLFSRHEKHEMLYLINQFAQMMRLDRVAALKVESLLREQLPSDTRSQANVIAWLKDAWAKHKH
jgi:hypothetical protein